METIKTNQSNTGVELLDLACNITSSERLRFKSIYHYVPTGELHDFVKEFIAQRAGSAEAVPVGYAPTYMADRLAAGDLSVMVAITAKPLPGHGVTTAIYTVPPPHPNSGRDAALIQPADMEALERFAECADDFDSGGHDVRKELVARLCEIGVLQSKGFGRHQITSFGSYVLATPTDEWRKLPLRTYAEINEDLRLAHESSIAAAIAAQQVEKGGA